MDTDWDVNEILGHIKLNGYVRKTFLASKEPEHMLNQCPQKLKQYWDNLLRNSTVSSTSSAPDVLEFTEVQNSSILQRTIQKPNSILHNTETTIQNTDTNQVSVQLQTDTNHNKKNQNLPNTKRKKKRKQMQTQNSNFCHPCSKSFFNAESLKRHQREIHNSNKRLNCYICKTGFSRKKA